jgi:hypothetical protein
MMNPTIPPKPKPVQITYASGVGRCGLLDSRITPARGRRLVRFRNCFCGVQAVKFYDGQFLCLRHFEADRARYRQDPKVTEENIKACNARCEKERYARLKADGLCVTCGKRPNYDGCVRCHECQAKRRAYRGKLVGGEHQWKAANRIFYAAGKSSPSNAKSEP